MQQDQFAYGKVDPVEAGKKGGQTGGSASGDGDSSSGSGSGGSDYKPTEHGGLRKDGEVNRFPHTSSFKP